MPEVITQISAIEMQIAELQQMLLPRELPRVPGYSFAAHYQPCDAAGGDFYAFQEFPDGTLGTAVADVSGHGVRAAVVMAMIRAWMAAYRQLDRQPQNITRDLNALFVDLGDTRTFVTGIFFRFNPSTGNYRFRNCGHPQPRIRRLDGSVYPVTGGLSLPLGIMPEQEEIEPASGQLQPGESIVLHTDGITESTGEDRTFFDEERLDAAISNCNGDAEAIVQSIRAAMLNHRQSRIRRDDECIVVIKRES